MVELTLKKREEDTLRVNIGEESFLIPLATGLTLSEAKEMDSIEGAINFFRKYIREEVADALTLMNYRELFSVWKEASEKVAKDEDFSLGES